MTQDTDQNSGVGNLCGKAKEIHGLRDAVLSKWEFRLRNEVKEARDLPYPILIDTFPAFVEQLAEAITPGYAPKPSRSFNSIASEHGGERARLTDYDTQSIISEYKLFRLVLFDVLTANTVALDGNEVHIVNASIDEAIRESVNAFALAQSLLRERYVAGLIDDLRNPLNTASVASEIMHSMTGNSRTRELASVVTDNLARMEAMIQQVLDALVFQPNERLRLRLTTWNIFWAAKEVCDQNTIIHGARFQLTGEGVTGHWDRHALKRAIEAMVESAVMYSAPQSLIMVKANSLQGRMILTVHNQGRPIPAEQIESVFQVYRRAVAAKRGDKNASDSGLPYVRHVAESHGGSFGIDSVVDLGTTYVLDLPIDSRPYIHAPTVGGDRY